MTFVKRIFAPHRGFKFSELEMSEYIVAFLWLDR